MKFRNLLTVGLLLVAIAAIPAQAALDMVLEIPGVDGDATLPGYEDQILVLAWSWGGSSPGCGGSVNYQDISLTKFLDPASVDFWGALRDGTVFPSATLRVVDPTSGAVGKSIAMSNVFLTSISTGGSGGENRLTENVSIGFSQAVITYTEIIGGKSGGPPESVTVTVQGCP